MAAGRSGRDDNVASSNNSNGNNGSNNSKSGGGGGGSNDGLVIIYNVIANRSVPIVFILVSSLIIANISCDQVGSTNELDLTPVAGDGYETSSASASVTTGGGGGNNNSAAKYDPLNMLREIYLDSKVITLLSSPSSSSVQKFHPNGRYGRRSVDNNFADPSNSHTELAKLRMDSADDGEGDTMPLRSLLQMDNPTGAPWHELGSSSKQQNQLRWLLANSHNSNSNSNSNNNKNKNNLRHKKLEDPTMDSTSSASFRQELNKLLKCNYSGVSNLFWCDS